MKVHKFKPVPKAYIQELVSKTFGVRRVVAKRYLVQMGTGYALAFLAGLIGEKMVGTALFLIVSLVAHFAVCSAKRASADEIATDFKGGSEWPLMDALERETAVQIGVQVEGLIPGEHGEGFVTQEWLSKSYLHFPSCYDVPATWFRATNEFASTWSKLLGNGRGLGTQLIYHWTITAKYMPCGQVLYQIIGNDKRLFVRHRDLDLVSLKHDAIELAKMIRTAGAKARELASTREFSSSVVP